MVFTTKQKIKKVRESEGQGWIEEKIHQACSEGEARGRKSTEKCEYLPYECPPNFHPVQVPTSVNRSLGEEEASLADETRCVEPKTQWLRDNLDHRWCLQCGGL